MNQTAAQMRLESGLEQALRDEEIMTASAILRAFPELTYGEALAHACAKLRKQREGVKS